MQSLFVDVLGETDWSGSGRTKMRNKDITLNVLLQDNDMSAQVPWYKSNVGNKNLLEKRSSRSGYAKIMATLFIDRKVGCRINIRKKNTFLNVLLQDNDISALVPYCIKPCSRQKFVGKVVP